MGSRLRRSSETRSQIVRAAGDLFNTQGIRCTTTDEVIEAVGIPKAEFHQHFKSRLELVDAVLRYHTEELAAGAGILKYGLDTWADLEECLASHVEFQRRSGMTRSCPIGRLGNELREEDELVRHSLNLALDLMIARLGCLFSREKMAGRLSSNVDVEQLANFCVVIIQGAMLTGKIRVDFRCVESIFEDLLNHLNRYAKVSQPRRKRVGRGRSPKPLSSLPKAPASTTLVDVHDSQDSRDFAENHLVDQSRPGDEA